MAPAQKNGSFSKWSRAGWCEECYWREMRHRLFRRREAVHTASPLPRRCRHSRCRHCRCRDCHPTTPPNGHMPPHAFTIITAPSHLHTINHDCSWPGAVLCDPSLAVAPLCSTILLRFLLGCTYHCTCTCYARLPDALTGARAFTPGCPDFSFRSRMSWRFIVS